MYTEDPGYLGARLAWQSACATVIPAPVQQNGVRLPLPAAANAALLYLTPSREQKERLLRAAGDCDLVPVAAHAATVVQVGGDALARFIQADGELRLIVQQRGSC